MHRRRRDKRYQDRHQHQHQHQHQHKHLHHHHHHTIVALSAGEDTPEDTSEVALGVVPNGVPNGVPNDAPNDGPKGAPKGLTLIHAGLFRTGTRSIAEAYRVLGLRVHHGLTDDFLDSPYPQIEVAAYATWPEILLPLLSSSSSSSSSSPSSSSSSSSSPPSSPSSPSSPSPPSPNQWERPPFTRADWDAIWGEYDVATDLASPFVEQLIQAYPDARVVVVQRDFDLWWHSFQTRVLTNIVTIHDMAMWLGWRVAGIRAVHALRAVMRGFFGTADLNDILTNRDRARTVYEGYYRRIRAAVPEHRRLEYRLGSGWAPLCEFLGRPVPDLPFPYLNEGEATERHIVECWWKYVWATLRRLASWFSAAAGLVLAGAIVWWCGKYCWP